MISQADNQYIPNKYNIFSILHNNHDTMDSHEECSAILVLSNNKLEKAALCYQN